jgi:hypothetical protein
VEISLGHLACLRIDRSECLEHRALTAREEFDPMLGDL